MPFEHMIQKASEYLSIEDVEQLRKAYQFAKQAHEGQVRKSGEPFINHPVAVTEILAELHMDLSTLAAGLLHDVVEDTDVTLEEIEEEFGGTVSHLVDGVTKLRKRVKFNSNEQHQAENYRKMFVAMAKDIRVIMIKLADRIHNMRTLKHMPEHKQREKSKETLEIFAPLAHRLGISKIKWELEDIALRYLNSQQYYRIVHLMKKKRAEREQYLEEVIKALRLRLEEMEVNVVDISGRPKHIYSIYRKMVKQHKEFNEIYDLMAVRVIVNTVRDCYAVLGIIHTIWKPMPGRFKDYIAMPKTNMYQSLHTTVIGPKGEPIEVQIRTKEMHRTAEYGIAAHWAYKEGATVEDSFEDKLKWFREMMELQQETIDAQEFVEGLKGDWFSDAVFVFTPKGDVIELPKGSIPLDFAYRIHTEIGNKCIGAKVDNKIVPLDYKLNTGERIEVLTSKHSYGPSRDWLKIVKTSHARSKIRSWFKKQRREESIEKGREMVEALLTKNEFEVNDVLTQDRTLEVAKKFNFQDTEDLFAAVGYGGISTAQVVHRLTDGLKVDEPIVLPEVKTMPHRNRDSGVRVKGIDNLLVRLSRCCNPVPGDDITGYVTQGRGVTVHRTDCNNLTAVPDERRISVEWDGALVHSYHVDIEVTGFDREGLLNDVLQAVYDTKTTLSAVNAKGDEKRGIASIHIRLCIQNTKHLQSVVERVKRVRDIYSVRRVMQ
ncbi:RelA/SpoT family protein [Hazenella coriacea]|uniref:GTP pyrophosphokinase n=1 Tax=Hazenella coriacea TaxID=1179467 RepID=A0A4R3L7A3_9BACL|nr:bifunctional (p)ppGpp synthetase/guanosine-3',5'-bis(diphosphate) 3'-pyrophosphohydrolase [Hazenella coriacea]TCS94915.1 GTP pyrophosphokinase [Hazenella coriacea]